MALSNDICIARLNSALLYPLQMRCHEVDRICDEFSSKELNNIFPILVGDIFGITNQIGWGLRTLFKSYHHQDYLFVLEFFHPQGSFFKMCYKLMSNNCYLKYEFPLTCLPISVKKMIDEGIMPSFYSDSLKVDPQSGTPVALALNPFEYYMFHFAYHLVNPCIQRTDGAEDLWDTAYLQLAENYAAYFLRCDNSSVPPLMGYYMTKTSTPLQTTNNRLARVPTLFRQSVLMPQNNTPNSLHSSCNSTQQSARMEIWRSELVAQVFLDFWMGCSSREIDRKHNQNDSPEKFYLSSTTISSNQSMLSPSKPELQNYSTMLRYPQLPSMEHIRIVRNYLKHMHYFSNSYVNDGTAMNELKRIILPSSQTKVYNFLRRTIDQWPLDSSFRLILETWLSYIQPWRYTNYWSNTKDKEEQNYCIDQRWLGFIAENLLAYTVVFRQLLNRFSRLDLVTPKNAVMLFRLSKVFDQPNLSSLLAEVESCLDETTASLSHKWTAIVRQQVNDLEGPGYLYTPMFGQQTETEILRFLYFVQEARRNANALLVHEELEKQRNPPSVLSSVLGFFTGSNGESGDYSIDDRKKVVSFLDIALEQLVSVFKIPVENLSYTQPPLDGKSLLDLNCSYTMNWSSYSNSQFLQQADDSMKTPLRGSPKEMKERTRRIRYEGDPDLEPIRSTENTFLVRILHQITSKINEMYSNEMSSCFHRRDFYGRVARQVLCPPLLIRTYDKNVSNHLSPRIETVLPPRLSLRSLAGHRFLVYFFIAVFIAYMWGCSPLNFSLILFGLWMLYIIIQATITPWLEMFSSQSPQMCDSIMGHDVSFTSS